ARRFVGEEDLRAMRQRSAERDALLLASGELSRAAVALRAEPDAVEELVRPPTALRARQAVQPELDGDELARGELRRQRACVVLVGVAEEGGPVARQSAGRDLREVVAVDTHQTGRRAVEAGQ